MRPHSFCATGVVNEKYCTMGVCLSASVPKIPCCDTPWVAASTLCSAPLITSCPGAGEAPVLANHSLKDFPLGNVSSTWVVMSVVKPWAPDENLATIG